MTWKMQLKDKTVDEAYDEKYLSKGLMMKADTLDELADKLGFTGDAKTTFLATVDTYNALYDAGITMNDVNPDYVVVGEGRAYSLDTLTKATNLVYNGAKLIGANSDVSGPVEGGIAPSCGALVAPIELATGKKAYFCGKPNPLMMRTGLRLLNCHSADAVMVGDRMDTDVISGLESGMSTVLVLSGVSTKETLNTYAYRPSVVLSGVGDIVKLAHGEL